MIINMEKYSTSIRFCPAEAFNLALDKKTLKNRLRQKAHEVVDKAFDEIDNDNDYIEYTIDDDGDCVVLGGTVKFGFGIEKIFSGRG